jgi:hypothetical protein
MRNTSTVDSFLGQNPRPPRVPRRGIEPKVRISIGRWRDVLSSDKSGTMLPHIRPVPAETRENIESPDEAKRGEITRSLQQDRVRPDSV